MPVRVIYSIAHKVVLDNPAYVSAGAPRSESATDQISSTFYSAGLERRYEFSFLLANWQPWDGLATPVDIIWQFKRFGSPADMFVGVKRNSLVLRYDGSAEATLINDVRPYVNQWVDVRIDVLWAQPLAAGPTCRCVFRSPTTLRSSQVLPDAESGVHHQPERLSDLGRTGRTPPRPRATRSPGSSTTTTSKCSRCRPARPNLLHVIERRSTSRREPSHLKSAVRRSAWPPAQAPRRPQAWLDGSHHGQSLVIAVGWMPPTCGSKG